MTAALLALAAMQELDALLERLRSEESATRDAAERALVRQGTSVLPQLRRRKEDPDPELRFRVLRAIGEIERLERIRPLRPAPVRLTLRLDRAPLAEALRRVFGPFGVKADVYPTELRTRNVTLDLSEAGLWAALDAFCAAADVHLDGEYTMPDLGWGFRDGAPPKPRREADAGEARLRAEFDERGQLALSGRLPPGSLPAAVRFQEVEVVDVLGRLLDVKAKSAEATAWRRAAGPTVFEDWRADVGEGAGPVTVRGTLVLVQPEDVDRAEFPIAGFEGPKEAALGGVTITLKSLSAADGYYGHEYEGLRWAPGTPPQRFYEWYEDGRGKLYAEGARYGVGGDSGSRGGKSRRGRETRLPAVFVVARLIKGEAVRFPFVIKDVPRPARR